MRFKPGKIGHYLLGLAIAVLFVLPLFWAMIASLQPVGTAPARTVLWWITDPHWENYRRIFQMIPLARYTINSLLVVAIAVPITLLIASTAGFGMSQLPAADRRQMVTLNAVLLLIPGAAVWLFRFQILRWLGILDSLWALIVPAFAASNPLFVLLYYQTFCTIPGDIFAAARLEGAGILTLWWQVALPPARPTTIGVAVLTAVLYWSDFIGPVLFIFNTNRYTIAVGLQLIKQLDATNWPLLMAAAITMTLPVLVVFTLLQRLFLHDISLASLIEE